MTTIQGQVTTLKNKDEEIRFPRTVSSAVYHDKTTLDKTLDNISKAIGALEGTESIDFDSYQLKNDEQLVTEENQEGNLVNYLLDVDNRLKANTITLGLREIGEATFGVPTGDIIINTSAITINEGTNGYISVHLSEAPSIKQIVFIELENSELCTINTNRLEFTKDNYNIDQDITINTIIQPNSYETMYTTLKLSSTIVEDKTVNITIYNTDLKDVESISVSESNTELHMNEDRVITVDLNPKPCNENIEFEVITEEGAGSHRFSVTQAGNALTLHPLAIGNKSKLVIKSIANPNITAEVTVNVLEAPTDTEQGGVTE